jgi:hypothetical protein
VFDRHLLHLVLLHIGIGSSLLVARLVLLKYRTFLSLILHPNYCRYQICSNNQFQIKGKVYIANTDPGEVACEQNFFKLGDQGWRNGGDDNIPIYSKAVNEGVLDDPQTTTQVIVFPFGRSDDLLKTSMILFCLRSFVGRWHPLAGVLIDRMSQRNCSSISLVRKQPF